MTLPAISETYKQDGIKMKESAIACESRNPKFLDLYFNFIFNK